MDLIESPPLQDLERINSTAGFEVVQGLSNRVIYLHLDTHADDTPGIKGVPAGKNPNSNHRARNNIMMPISDNQRLLSDLDFAHSTLFRVSHFAFQTPLTRYPIRYTHHQEIP